MYNMKQQIADNQRAPIGTVIVGMGFTSGKEPRRRIAEVAAPPLFISFGVASGGARRDPRRALLLRSSRRASFRSSF
jgi:hypothetical protein